MAADGGTGRSRLQLSVDAVHFLSGIVFLSRTGLSASSVCTQVFQVDRPMLIPVST